MWADPGGTAIQGQPVTEVEQAPSTPSFSKNQFNILVLQCRTYQILTLRLLISYIYGAPSKARNANVVYIWTYVWQR